MQAGFLKALALALVGVLIAGSDAGAAPIYIYFQKDGTKKFSNIPPPSGVQAQVFTARKSAFAWYRGTPQYGGRDFKKIYGARFDGYITRAAEETGLDAALIKAVIHAESGFNPHAISPKGAQGLMQLMPGTARDLGVQNAFAPQENIRGGSRYLQMLLGRFDGNLAHALAAYNAGMDNVDRYGGIPPFEETRKYVKIVTELHNRYRSLNG